MLKFAANLTTLFSEVPFLERFSKAKATGFQYVEFQFPYMYAPEEIKQEIESFQLEVVLFNLPPGQWDKGERGMAIFPERRQEFRESIEEAMRYALAFNCQRLHCMAGIRPDGLSEEDAMAVYRENISYAAGKLAEKGLTLLIEPINPVDMPGYFLSSIQQAHRLISDLALANLKLQFDFYHVQRIQGELISTFDRLKDWIGHVQIADNPGRHEPGTGEIHYAAIFRFLEHISYQGYIGLEYTPSGVTADSLRWLNRFIK